jgi:protein-tyrosine-phosphatase
MCDDRRTNSSLRPPLQYVTNPPEAPREWAPGRIARSWLSRLRHVPDRLTHSTRHKRALAQLEGVLGGEVLVLCHGNVCRSPFAAELLAQRAAEALGGRFTTTSAGFIGPDRPSPDDALAVSQALGIDLSAHRSRLVTAEMIRAAALILVMSRAQAIAIERRTPDVTTPIIILGDLDPMPILTRTILDPWGGGPDAFQASYARIVRCVDTLVESLRGR